MQLRGRMRLAACLAPPFVAFGLVALFACRDSTATHNPVISDTVTARRSAIQSLQGSRRRGPAADKFHKRNRMDWVGEAHNNGLSAYFADKRGRKFKSRNLCEDVVDFFDNRANIYPKHLPQPSKKQRHSWDVIGIGLVPCGRSLADLSTARDAVFRAPQSATVDLSAAAMALIDDIGVSVDAAYTAEELATALNGVLDRTSSLGAPETDVIGAIASLTQSSFEYWAANYESVGYDLASQIAAEYPGCGVDDKSSSCFVGPWATPDRRTNSSPYILASLYNAPPCPTGAKFSGRDIIKADFAGAVHGLVYGGWATWGLSIIGSGVVASGGAMLWNVAVDLTCWLR